ncbi:MAG: hypothetical protein ACP5RH_22920 [Leptodesmis sp.]|uniref:hypothetical protein n=1 Tax=Leptodesmis sp. TaxID=3100501 RepID=UPI003D0DF043
MASTTIRGKEYAIARITDVIIKELTNHSNEGQSREYRHRNTFNLLKVVLDPPLPDEFFLADISLLLLNDVEIYAIISAAAEALMEDGNFSGSLEKMAKNSPEAISAIAQLRTLLGKPEPKPVVSATPSSPEPSLTYEEIVAALEQFKKTKAL